MGHVVTLKHVDCQLRNGNITQQHATPCSVNNTPGSPILRWACSRAVQPYSHTPPLTHSFLYSFLPLHMKLLNKIPFHYRICTLCVCVCVCVCVCACVCVQPVHDNMQLELFALSYIQICTCASCVRSSCQSECSPRHVASSRSCQVCSLDHRTLSGLGIQESLLLVTTGSPICARFASLLFSTAS